MKKKKIEDMTFEEIKAAGLCEISKTPFSKVMASHLDTKKKIESFKKGAIKEFNQTGGIGAFLENLKIIAIAQGNIAELARKSKMPRPNIYRILSGSTDPHISNVMTITKNLGIKFEAKML
jgi:DNA-binding phage protein